MSWSSVGQLTPTPFRRFSSNHTCAPLLNSAEVILRMKYSGRGLFFGLTSAVILLNLLSWAIFAAPLIQPAFQGRLDIQARLDIHDNLSVAYFIFIAFGIFSSLLVPSFLLYRDMAGRALASAITLFLLLVLVIWWFVRTHGT